MQMRYYGDIVSIDAIDDKAHPTAYVIQHNGSEKRTILEKLQFIDWALLCGDGHGYGATRS